MDDDTRIFNPEDEFAALRRRTKAHLPGGDHYVYEVDGIRYDGHFMHDIKRLLTEVDRLRERLGSVESRSRDPRAECPDEWCPGWKDSGICKYGYIYRH